MDPTWALAPDERSGFRFLLLGTYEPGQNEKEVFLGPLILRDPAVDLVMLATDVGSDTETWIAGLRASRVIACRWRQDAAASEVFMRAFYARWRGESGPTPASLALLEGQKAVASKPEYAHPYYWAGWQLWGLP